MPGRNARIQEKFYYRSPLPLSPPPPIDGYPFITEKIKIYDIVLLYYVMDWGMTKKNKNNIWAYKKTKTIRITSDSYHDNANLVIRL